MRNSVVILMVLFALGNNATAQYAVTSIPYNPYPYNMGTPTLVNIDDVWSDVINIPFNFYFFGNNYNKLVIGANSCISFDTTNANGYCDWHLTDSCPSPNILGGKGPFIFCPYEDIDASTAGNVYDTVVGTYPYRKFIVSWDSIPMYSCTDSIATNQVVLYESYNYIDVYIKHKPLCSGWNSGNAVIGIQNDTGGIGFTPPGRNTSQWTATNEAWRFYLSGPYITIANIIPSDCGSNNGAINTTYGGGVPPYTFHWNSTPPQSGNNLTNVPPGNYCVTITDYNGDSAITCGTVDTTTYPTPEICMVSVDTATNHNIVIWEEIPTTGIDKYYIYRETAMSGIYNLIGTQDYNNLSTFIDTGSNSLQQAYRYKIAIHDYCGNTTSQSSYHQTIHLSINAGTGGTWNLIWNNYIGFPFNTYYIYRGTNSNNITLLDSVSSNVTSYTDVNPPSGVVYYLIEAVNPNNCNPSKSSYSSTMSNIITSAGLNTSEINDINNIKISPNPASNIIFLSIDNPKVYEWKLDIYNLIGDLVKSKTFNQNNEQIDVKNLKSGIYIVEIKTKDWSIKRKLIIQK